MDEQVGGSVGIATSELDAVSECKGFLFDADWAIANLFDTVEVYNDDILLVIQPIEGPSAIDQSPTIYITLGSAEVEEQCSADPLNVKIEPGIVELNDASLDVFQSNSITSSGDH